jgi:hypothetical protein
MKATVYPIDTALPYRLAIVARPRGDDWLCDELVALSHEGADVLVSMLTSDETQELGLQKEGDLCSAAAMQFVNLPIIDRSVPSDKDVFLREIDRLADLLRNGRSVAVPCRASIGRSSVLAASVLVRLGWNPSEAFEAVETARGCQFQIPLTSGNG